MTRKELEALANRYVDKQYEPWVELELNDELDRDIAKVDFIAGFLACRDAASAIAYEEQEDKVGDRISRLGGRTKGAHRREES